MYLTSRFGPRLTERVRRRGQSYFDRGRVEISRGDKQVVQAVVTGSERYRVFLRVEGRDLLAECTCPYYETSLCKHLWATMIAAERKGFLTGTGHLPTRLVMADPTDFDEDGYDDDDDERYLGTTRASRLKVQPATKPPIWLQQLESVGQSMRVSPDERVRPWPSSRQLFYIVDVRSTLRGYGLTISLGWREMKRTGDWGKIRMTGLPAVHVSQISEPDRQIIALLMGGRDLYGYSYALSYS
ncbi:MAG TPA: SWIM zinc finger family protein, partial [Blastocatellia bacterium]|nr:SWIM zinc finger family protein [Blastocatellia bacterium]